MPRNFYFFFLFFALLSCSNPDINRNEETKLLEGEWRFTMSVQNELLPFNAKLNGLKSSKPSLSLYNADEEIVIDDLTITEDSLIAHLPFFNTALYLGLDSPDLLSGVWIDHNRDNYCIPITGEYSKPFRFTNAKSSLNISDRYYVEFDSEDPYPAVLELTNSEGFLTGTFLTETGDYRYLQGNIMNSEIHLSTFDGSHAFLFRAKIDGDSLVNGRFLSGNHFSTDWRGAVDSVTTLRNPVSITESELGTPFDFELPNQDGQIVTWQDLNLDNKVVVIDIMGTWCPNCMDASIALDELASNYDQDEITIVPVLFEYKDDLGWAQKAFSKYTEKLDTRRNFLFGGKASKKRANEVFPMLSSVSSFPTLVFIGPDRQIAQIYTGFYGPGTGSHYDDFMKNTRKLLDSLVNERPSP